MPTETSAKLRQTRYSTRLAKSRANPKLQNLGDDDSALDQDDNEASQVSGHSHLSAESYDVFREHPQLSPGKGHTLSCSGGPLLTSDQQQAAQKVLQRRACKSTIEGLRKCVSNCVIVLSFRVARHCTP